MVWVLTSLETLGKLFYLLTLNMVIRKRGITQD